MAICNAIKFAVQSHLIRSGRAIFRFCSVLIGTPLRICPLTNGDISRSLSHLRRGLKELDTLRKTSGVVFMEITFS